MAIKRRGRRFYGSARAIPLAFCLCRRDAPTTMFAGNARLRAVMMSTITWRVNNMVYYYVYMALLVTSLVLWVIIAVREDGGENGDTKQGD